MILSILSDCFDSCDIFLKENASVSHLKEKICQLHGIPSDQFELFQNGKLINEDTSLLGVSTTLCLKLKLLGGIKIHIKIQNIKTLDFDIPNPETTSIKNIKMKINSKMDYKDSEYTLSFNGEKLKDESTISSLNLSESSIIDFVPFKPSIVIKYLENLKTIELENGFNTTVSDLQKSIKDKLFPELSEKDMVLANEEGNKLTILHATLNYQGINKPNQIIKLSLNTTTELFIIVVKSSKIITIELPTSLNITIGEIKKKLFEKIGNDALKLFFGGQYLTDDNITALQVGLQAGCTINAIAEVIGGNNFSIIF